mmetsp:Transcript_7174/g.18395  ORF Transcript_7174/g.18395 Transcript_7174/m.18395 type:complete len:216 (+) Transcript_7174:2859-3506(+)
MLAGANFCKEFCRFRCVHDPIMPHVPTAMGRLKPLLQRCGEVGQVPKREGFVEGCGAGPVVHSAVRHTKIPTPTFAAAVDKVRCALDNVGHPRDCHADVRATGEHVNPNLGHASCNLHPGIDVVDNAARGAKDFGNRPDEGKGIATPTAGHVLNLLRNLGEHVAVPHHLVEDLLLHNLHLLQRFGVAPHVRINHLEPRIDVRFDRRHSVLDFERQ